jgi:hypothetical protein
VNVIGRGFSVSIGVGLDVGISLLQLLKNVIVYKTRIPHKIESITLDIIVEIIPWSFLIKFSYYFKFIVIIFMS